MAEQFPPEPLPSTQKLTGCAGASHGDDKSSDTGVTAADEGDSNNHICCEASDDIHVSESCDGPGAWEERARDTEQVPAIVMSVTNGVKSGACVT